MTSRRMIVLVLVIGLAATLTACGNDAEEPQSTGDAQEPAAIRIGTLPTEDMLPLWVADEEGLFDAAGLDVEIVTFQAAQERDAAFTAGEIDAFMGDIIAATALEAGETGVTIGTIMLGATPAEGRFGIVASPESGFQNLEALAGGGGRAPVPVGTSSATIQEYVLDGLMRQAGVPADSTAKEEVKKVPVRFDLLMNGQLVAAALPEPFLSLAEAQGAKLLADDTTGENLSQTILGFSDDYLAGPGGIEALMVLLDVWDQGVAKVNADPDAWRALLVDKARLPEPIKDTYDISTYPEHQVPTEDQVDAVLTWMRGEGLLEADVAYEDLTLVTP